MFSSAPVAVSAGALYELEFNHGSMYGEEEAAALSEVLSASAPSCGPKVQEFERAFAAYCGTTSAIAVTNATAGLQLAMIAARVGPGDEVITTPISWIATANAAAIQGVTVVFADVDPRTLNLRSFGRAEGQCTDQGDYCRAPVRPVLRHGYPSYFPT